MAYGVLLLGCHLGSGLLVALGNEDWVVAEAVIAAGRGRDAALDYAFRGERGFGIWPFASRASSPAVLPSELDELFPLECSSRIVSAANESKWFLLLLGAIRHGADLRVL